MQQLRSILFCATLLLIAGSVPGQTARLPERKHFYEAMQLENRDLVLAQLKILEKTTLKIRQPFEGALLMKKAGLGANPAKKLSEFKKGHSELEAAIKADPDNAEFRFLRLMIQEHAPGILGYNKEIQTDGDYIMKSFKSLPGEVQQAITEYSKKSKVLKPGVS